MTSELTPPPTTTHKPKAERVQSMFASIASRYDTANQVLSFGIHHYWRRKLIQASGAKPGQRILDCATGTGDLAIAFQRHLGNQAFEVIGVDFCEPMLSLAPGKAEKAGVKNIRFQWADVTHLPFPDDSFDIVSISFGIRNVEEPTRAIAEMTRVLKPGGKLCILEFGNEARNTSLWDRLYAWYSTRLLPKLGGFITQKPEAYEYLQTSSAHFPAGEAFLSWLKAEPRLTAWRYHSLFPPGICYLYLATKKS